jgi:hypothetical protein
VVLRVGKPRIADRLERKWRVVNVEIMPSPSEQTIDEAKQSDDA